MGCHVYLSQMILGEGMQDEESNGWARRRSGCGSNWEAGRPSYDPVRWADGNFHVAGVFYQTGGRYDPSDELAWTGFGTVAGLTRAVIAELEALEWVIA